MDVNRVFSLEHPGARVLIQELPIGRRRIHVEPLTPEVEVSLASWETCYPLELIQSIYRVKGPSHLCDEIARDEADRYVRRSLEVSVLSYVDEGAFVGKTILDFGCGCGASTIVVSRLFPESLITGVDLEEDYLGVADARSRYYGLQNVRFLRSPSAEQLPEKIGSFDFAILSAVYEHLLPRERRKVMPLVWEKLKPGGILFLNQTPHRYSPVESHTTNLLLINYLPDRLAHAYARRFSKRVANTESWETLLRRGVRGGTVAEITGMVGSSSRSKPVLLQPCRLGLKDPIDVWFYHSGGVRLVAVKRMARSFLKVVRALTGVTLVPSLSIALKKPEVTSP